jgi:hypothetical protein
MKNKFNFFRSDVSLKLFVVAFRTRSEAMRKLQATTTTQMEDIHALAQPQVP